MKFSCNHFFAFAFVLITDWTFKKTFVRGMRGKVDGGSERESLFYDGISIDLKKAGCQKFEEFKQTYLLNVP